MRADEHEGELSDPNVKRAKDKVKRRADEIISENVFAMTENKAFLFWFGRWFAPMLDTSIPVDGGAKLVAFMGKREILIQMMNEMDVASPGFIARVLEVRATFDNELRATAQEE